MTVVKASFSTFFNRHDILSAHWVFLKERKELEGCLKRLERVYVGGGQEREDLSVNAFFILSALEEKAQNENP